MIRHHPSEATLIAQAAGHLPLLHARVLAVHLAACPRCRNELREMEEVGGALLATLPPASLRPLPLTLVRFAAYARKRRGSKILRFLPPSSQRWRPADGGGWGRASG